MHMLFACWIFYFLLFNHKFYFYEIEIIAIMVFILLFIINKFILNKQRIGVFELLLKKLTYLGHIK